MTSLRYFLQALWLSVTALFLVSCSQEKPLVFGAILPLEGPASYVGHEVKDGLQLAIDKINSDGGINGKPIQLHIENSYNQGQSVGSAFAKLKRKNPFLIITGTSSVAMTTRQLSEQEKIPLFALVATVPDLTKNTEFVYRYWPLANLEVPSLSKVLPKNNSSIGVLYLFDAYGQSVFQHLKDRFEGSDNTLLGVPYKIAKKEFKKEIDKLINHDAIVIVGFDAHIRTILKELRLRKYKGIIASTTTATLPSITSTLESDGIFVAAPAIYNPTYELAKMASESYQMTYQKPFNHYAANGYDLIHLIGGLLHDKPISQATLQTELDKGFIFSGALGNMELKPKSGDIAFPLYPAKIENGRIIYF